MRIKILNLCYYVKTVFDKKMANSANSIRLICSNWHCRPEKNIPQKSMNSYSRSAGADIIGLSPF